MKREGNSKDLILWSSEVARPAIFARYMDGTRHSRRNQVLNRGLSAALIEELDEDGDGEVTRIEWLKGMLVALEEVDEEL